MNKKEKRAALKSVLTSKFNDSDLIVLDSLSFGEVKTKNMKKVLDSLKADKAYVVIDKKDDNVFLSSRNLPNMQLSTAGSLSVYDILKYKKLILTRDAVKTIEEVFA
jgi:large subunit ribosomal protein L4